MPRTSSIRGVVMQRRMPHSQSVRCCGALPPNPAVIQAGFFIGVIAPVQSELADERCCERRHYSAKCERYGCADDTGEFADERDGIP